MIVSLLPYSLLVLHTSPKHMNTSWTRRKSLSTVILETLYDKFIFYISLERYSNSEIPSQQYFTKTIGRVTSQGRYPRRSSVIFLTTQIQSAFNTGLQNKVLGNQERGEEEEGTDFLETVEVKCFGEIGCNLWD